MLVLLPAIRSDLIVRQRVRQYIRSTAATHEPEAMARAKSETLTIRTTPEIKELLRLAAEREHRSVASMVEILVLQYAKQTKLALPGAESAA